MTPHQGCGGGWLLGALHIILDLLGFSDFTVFINFFTSKVLYLHACMLVELLKIDAHLLFPDRLYLHMP